MVSGLPAQTADGEPESKQENGKLFRHSCVFIVTQANPSLMIVLLSNFIK